jgi:hypothetical protein
MVDYFPLSRLKSLNGAANKPHWRAFNEKGSDGELHAGVEFQRPDGTGDYGGIHLADMYSFGPSVESNLELLAAARNAMPHMIAAVEAAFNLEAIAPDDPAIAALSRALDVFREKGRVKGPSVGKGAGRRGP